MPVPKPTALPRWADQPSALITEPNEGKKDVGWAPGDEPPAPYFNWWQRLVYSWVQWLNALLDQPNSWSAPQTFRGAVVNGVLGGPVPLTVTGANGASLPFGPGLAGSDGAAVSGGAGGSAFRGPGADGGAGLVARGGNGGSGTSGVGAGGAGLHGIGGAGGTGSPIVISGPGVVGDGGGNAPGVRATGGPTGPGVAAVAGGGATPLRGALALSPQAPPSSPGDGDLWVDSAAGALRANVGGKTDTVATKTVVDAGDAATLAAAEQYADGRGVIGYTFGAASITVAAGVGFYIRPGFADVADANRAIVIISRPGVLRNLRIVVTNGPSYNPTAFRLYFEKNGQLHNGPTDPSVTWVQPNDADTAHTLAVVAGDRIAIYTGPSPLPAGTQIQFVFLSFELTPS